MMSILRTMADRGDKRPVTLLYGSRTWDDAHFREELETLTERLDLTVVHTLEQPPEGWEGETGFVTREMLSRYLPPKDVRYRVLICGPLGMLNAVEKALESLGVPESVIDLERFDLA